MKLKSSFSRSIGVASICLAAGLGAPLFAAEPAAHTFSIGETNFMLDGQPFQIRCGEMHSARVPREYWQHRLKMAKAMGLNTVCAYLFWNEHEPLPGQFEWSGQSDVAEFCRLAQQEGLWVILRPGPYACAEWEMGGFPWWLLKYDDIKLRTTDPRYVDAARSYLKEVGRVLGPLQITHGGPIIMVQVENEYGFFGKDAGYMGVMRQAVLDAGFDVPLFDCNPTAHLRDGYRSDLFPVVNFGSDPARNFRALRRILPTGPLMCGEFYSGWFDTWGSPHHTGEMGSYLTDLEYMLKNGESFSIYLAHGGTTFGLWSGADSPFKPDTSSYDYSAPITEAGWTTDKYFKTRELFAKYLQPGETLPDPPATNPVVTIPAVAADGCAPLFANLPEPVSSTEPRNMEYYDQGHGCILYRTTIPAGPAETLQAGEIHDFGFVFLDGASVGTMDRRISQYKIKLPARDKPATLDLLVEAVGRVNFSTGVHDRKGVHGPVQLVEADHATVLTNWQVFKFPLDDAMLAGEHYGDAQTKGPAFWHMDFNLDTPGDTFLDLSSWGKGVVWVNGHCLGRFWNIGPTQTAYAPGPWLKAGKNEVVIFDLLGPTKAQVAGLAEPILNDLRPELDFSQIHRPIVNLALDSTTPVFKGQFKPGADLQEVKFPQLATGRYFCIESLSAQDGKPYAAIGELDLLDETGKPISHEGWTVAYVDSEERAVEDGTAENAIDGQVVNFWLTEHSAAHPNHPHRLVLDLGQARTVGGIRYVPRQGADVIGRIKDYQIYVGDGLIKK
jgi:beta-galactosidase